MNQIAERWAGDRGCSDNAQSNHGIHGSGWIPARPRLSTLSLSVGLSLALSFSLVLSVALFGLLSTRAGAPSDAPVPRTFSFGRGRSKSHPRGRWRSQVNAS